MCLAEKVLLDRLAKGKIFAIISTTNIPISPPSILEASVDSMPEGPHIDA
jgi:hypothetical protein